MMSVSVVGLGPVGLVTAACLAKRGYKVFGIDLDNEKLAQIRSAKPPFFEPDLEKYLEETVSKGTLSVANDFSPIAESDLVFVTVGTPGKPNGSVDNTYVKNAAVSIGQSLRHSHRKQVVIIKSTVTPGTARNIVRPVLQRESGRIAGTGFGLCSNPEFLREGSAIHDTEFPDRIVMGSDDVGTIARLEEFYEELHGGVPPPIVRTSHENAELIKYASNAFLATKVSFINCIANIAERVPHADVKTIAAGIGLDKRIGHEFMNAGLGWGGSCFPKDLWALLAFGRSLGYEPEMIEAVIATNQKQPRRAAQLASQLLNTLHGRRMAVLGLAFKPNTDDMREAVSIPIIRELLAEGAHIVAYDPAATANARTIFGNAIEYATNPVECISGVDCCILTTEWDEFKTLAPELFLDHMRTPVLIDGRRIYDVDRFSRAGVTLLGIGLGPRTSLALGQAQ
jgi:UDPglucose 6-dehydrogenase